MAVDIHKLEPTKKELLKFIHFPIDVIYKGNQYYVPDLANDMLTTFLPEENPAYEFCESAFFMAYRDGKPVGRIAGIINKLVNERTGKAEVALVLSISSTMRKWWMRSMVQWLTGRKARA